MMMGNSTCNRRETRLAARRNTSGGAPRPAAVLKGDAHAHHGLVNAQYQSAEEASHLREECREKERAAVAQWNAERRHYIKIRVFVYKNHAGTNIIRRYYKFEYDPERIRMRWQASPPAHCKREVVYGWREPDAA